MGFQKASFGAVRVYEGFVGSVAVPLGFEWFAWKFGLWFIWEFRILLFFWGLGSFLWDLVFNVHAGPGFGNFGNLRDLC